MADYTGAFPESLFFDSPPPAPTLELWFWNYSGDATLRWAPTADDISTYEIERSTDGGITWSPGSTFAPGTLFGDYLTRLEGGLTPGITYTWRLRASNAAGTSAWSNLVTSTCITAASEPQNLTATSGAGEVALLWDAPLSDGGSPVTHYRVDYKASTDSTWISATTSTSSPYTVTALVNGTAYDFRVRAMNETAYSANFFATTTATPASADEIATGTPITVTVTPTAQAMLTGSQQAASTGTGVNLAIPTTPGTLAGSQTAAASPLLVTASAPLAIATATGSQVATGSPMTVRATIPIAAAYRDGQMFSEADIDITITIPGAAATVEGVITATSANTVITAAIPTAAAYIVTTADAIPTAIRVTAQATAEQVIPAQAGLPLDEDSGPGLVVFDSEAFAELEVPVEMPTGGLLDPISGDWIIAPVESDPLAVEGVTPVVGAVVIPENLAEGMSAEFELPELATPMPAKALVRVSPEMPSPASRLGRLGQPRPNQFVPDTVTTEVYGRLRVVIEGRDVTYHRGVPCEIVSITEAEPFGSLAAVVRFPSLSPFQALTGKNAVFREGNDIKITVVSVDGTQTLATLFEGYIVEREGEVTSDEVGVTVQCQGALYYADFSMAQPKLRWPYADIGRKIASRLNPTKRRRWRRMDLDEFQTGIMTTHRGSWEPVLTGFVGDLLAMATTEDGQSQWTLHLDPGRKPVIRLKDRTTVHHTVTLGTPGVSVSLRRDVTSAVSTIYGQGVDDKNRSYANLKIPLYNPETPDFVYPYDNPATVMTIGSTDAGTISGDGVTRVQRRLRDAGFGVKVTGTYNKDTADAVKEWQRSTGGDVTGTLGGQTWASLMMVGPSAGAYKMAYYAPFASLSKVEPWLINADGSRTTRNPNYDDDAFRIERFRVFPDGTSKRDASRAANAELKRDKDPGWIGSVTLTVDPQEGSRWAIRAGQNILVKGWEGSNLLLHIASVTKSPNGGTVTLEVDSKARDLLTLDAIVRRDRDNLSPGARRRGAKQTAANIAPNPIVDSELTGWVIKHAVEAQKWTVLRVPLGLDGSIVGVELDTDPMSRFAVALFTDKVTPAKLARLVGNPLMYRVDELRPFPGDEETANELARLGWIDTIGGPEQAAGFWPGAESDEDPLTGKHRDNGISISFESRRPPFIWIATWADSATFLEGRLLRDPQRW